MIIGDQLRGQAKAINQQKTNSNITNIISADQVGRFPDSNIGDALKRIPVISMQNDQGEARNIIIRGLAPESNSVSLNGNRIPSAEGDNRNVQMDLIPSDMISTVEVNKTLTSDMDADAIGGSVNLVTRAAPNKMRLSATLQGGVNPIRHKGTYSSFLIYGSRFFNKKLGLVVSLSHLEKNYGSDNIESKWRVDEKSNQIYTSEMDIRRYDIQRLRNSVSTALDYRINDNHKVSANLIYNWRYDRENRYRLRYKDIEPISYAEDNTISMYKSKVRRQPKGGIDNNKNKNRRLEDQRIQNYALQGEHLLTPWLDFDWNLSCSKASEERPNERYIEFQQKNVTIEADFFNTKYPFLNTLDESDKDMIIKDLTENKNKTTEKEYSFKFSFRTPLSIIENQKGRLRFGLRGRYKDKNRNNVFYAYTPIGVIGSLSEMPTRYWSGVNFQPGEKYVPGLFIDKSYLGGLSLEDELYYSKKAVTEEYLPKNYKAKENVSAAYLRWDQNISDKFLVILGLRAEYTYINYKGNYIPNIEEEAFQVISKNNNYWNILPNVNLKYNATNNLVLRAAFTTALARPNYYSLVLYMNINSADSEHKFSAGNPKLKASQSLKFDLLGEYYFSSVGLISAGVFYKKMNRFIYTYKNMKYSIENFLSDFPDIKNPIQKDEFWEFTQDRNGSSVNLMGIEIAFQRKLDFMLSQFLRNFAFYVNYTYSHSKAKGVSDEEGNERKNISLPGTAPHMANASLSWENKRFSARLSLNYTSDYVDVLGNKEFYDSYYDRQMFLDLNASYKLTKNFHLFAEANNLTNQPLRYYQGEKERVQQLEYYRATFNFGLKYNF